MQKRWKEVKWCAQGINTDHCGREGKRLVWGGGGTMVFGPIYRSLNRIKEFLSIRHKNIYLFACNMHQCTRR